MVIKERSALFCGTDAGWDELGARQRIRAQTEKQFNLRKLRVTALLGCGEDKIWRING
jgi:hypothetical protein